MFIIKISIGVLAVVTVTCFAKLKCKKMQSEYSFLIALNEYFKSIKAATSYKKTKLTEILINSEDLNEFLGNFPISGKINDLTLPDYLSESDKLKISTVFSQIVTLDAKSLSEALSEYIEEFIIIIEEKRINLIKRKPVYLKVGFAVGLMLFIMVI